jgi:hypothetical protein
MKFKIRESRAVQSAIGALIGAIVVVGVGVGMAVTHHGTPQVTFNPAANGATATVSTAPSGAFAVSPATSITGPARHPVSITTSVSITTRRAAVRQQDDTAPPADPTTDPGTDPTDAGGPPVHPAPINPSNVPEGSPGPGNPSIVTP